MCRGHGARWNYRTDNVSKASRKLQVGDEALTYFNGPGSLALVMITERFDEANRQSRICFRVWPLLKNCDETSKLDADWFEPVPGKLL